MPRLFILSKFVFETALVRVLVSPYFFKRDVLYPGPITELGIKLFEFIFEIPELKLRLRLFNLMSLLIIEFYFLLSYPADKHSLKVGKLLYSFSSISFVIYSSSFASYLETNSEQTYELNYFY